MISDRYRCPHCTGRQLILTWVWLADGRRNIRGTCVHCKKHVAWVEQTDLTRAEADETPAPEPEPDLFSQLGGSHGD